MEIIFLEPGDDLESQLRALELARRRRWYMKVSRKDWAIIGIFAGVLLCGIVAFVITQIL